MDAERGATIGERVRALRKRRRMTQEDLAAAAGVRRSTIQNIESGRTSEPYTVDKIARALNVPVEQLLDGGDVPQPSPEDRSLWQVVIRGKDPTDRELAESVRRAIEARNAPSTDRGDRAAPDEGSSSSTG